MDWQSILSAIQNSQQILRTATTSIGTIDSDLDNVLGQINSQPPDMSSTLSDVKLPTDGHGRLDRQDVKDWLGQVEANMSEDGLLLPHIKVENAIRSHPRIDNVNSMVHPIPGSSSQSVSDLDFKKIEKEMNELYSGETQNVTETKFAPDSRGQKVKVNVSEMLDINVIDDSSSSDEEIIPKKNAQKKKKKKAKELRQSGKNRRCN